MPALPAPLRTPGTPRRLLIAAAFAWVLPGAAAAAEVTVFAAPAFQPVLVAMAPAFEKSHGGKVLVIADRPEALAQRIRAGEAFDLAVLPEALLETLAEEGGVAGGSITTLARERSGPPATPYAGAMSSEPGNPPGAMSLLVLLASEATQAVLARHGLAAP